MIKAFVNKVPLPHAFLAFQLAPDDCTYAATCAELSMDLTNSLLALCRHLLISCACLSHLWTNAPIDGLIIFCFGIVQALVGSHEGLALLKGNVTGNNFDGGNVSS